MSCNNVCLLNFIHINDDTTEGVQFIARKTRLAYLTYSNKRSYSDKRPPPENKIHDHVHYGHDNYVWALPKHIEFASIL